MRITLNHTYDLKPKLAERLSVLFHERAQVLPWQALGPADFIKRYLNEVIKHGYRQTQLAEKTYGFEARFIADPKRPFCSPPKRLFDDKSAAERSIVDGEHK